MTSPAPITLDRSQIRHSQLGTEDYLYDNAQAVMIGLIKELNSKEPLKNDVFSFTLPIPIPDEENKLT